MAKILYIIGNGFDRYHELDTRYQAFAFYLQDNYSQIHEYLVNYYGLPWLDRDNENDHRDPLWAEFEKALADLDFETVLDENSDLAANPASDDFKDRDWHSYQFEMERIVDELTTALCNAFKEFISQVKFPEDPSVTLLMLERDSVFLSFNYTNTLERYYGIHRDKILYIHGRALDQNTNLILGHGVDPDNFKPTEKEPPVGLSYEEQQEWLEQNDDYEYSFDQAQQEILNYFVKSHKSTEELIQNHSHFFNSLKLIEKVVVLGHSLGEVDLAYFKKVIELTKEKGVEWTITYYADWERDSHLTTMLSLGLVEEQIKLVKIPDLVAKQPTLF